MEKNLKANKSRNGLGAIAQKSFKAGVIISEITGNIIHWRTLQKIGGVILDNTYRFDHENYLSPDGIGNYVNHSCEPNSGIIKKTNSLYLKSILPIKKGEEVVFDYSTIIGADDTWSLKCNCGSKKCRKKVKNFTQIPKDTLNQYILFGVIPIYILETKN